MDRIPLQQTLAAAALTAAALVAFAANSVLCRMALGGGAIDAAAFTAIRLVAGAAALWLIAAARRRTSDFRGDWTSAAMLFAYAFAFSAAYLSLNTGTGALILFGAVQLTMILAGLRQGERPLPKEWGGLAVAFGGLIYLLLPGLRAPSLTGSLLMVASGIAWGIYSLRGRGQSDPLAVTAGNFLRTTPFVLALALFALPTLHLTPRGVLLAVLSGAIASGIGYVIWYAALRTLSAMRAATVQLSVPVLAAGGGMIFLSEEITLRWIFSAVAVLGGVALALAGRQRLARRYRGAD